MKFMIYKTSDFNFKEEKELNTLEELIEFIKNNGDIVIHKDANDANPLRVIEIYDDYRE